MAKIVIDAGHGGDDPGASGNGIIEKDLTLKISQYMYDRFRDLGIPVKMTRTTDETISPTERVKRVLDAYGNSNDVIVISNHINAGGGASFYVIKLCVGV
jgi:N-acetylmuramoyl-L-alanine amidase